MAARLAHDVVEDSLAPGDVGAGGAFGVPVAFGQCEEGGAGDEHVAQEAPAFAGGQCVVELGTSWAGVMYLASALAATTSASVCT